MSLLTAEVWPKTIFAHLLSKNKLPLLFSPLKLVGPECLELRFVFLAAVQILVQILQELAFSALSPFRKSLLFKDYKVLCDWRRCG